jgi:tetratricopeptide (TPR) repeat protein
VFKSFVAFVVIVGLTPIMSAASGDRQLPDHLEKFCDAQIQYRLAWRLENSGAYEKALTAFRKNISNHQNDTFEFTQKYVAQSMIRAALSLHKLGRDDEAIVIYDEVLQRYEGSSFIPLMDQVAWALNNKGYTVAKMGRHDEALELYERFFGRARETATNQFNKAKCLAIGNRSKSLAALGQTSQSPIERCTYPTQDAVIPPPDPLKCNDARLEQGVGAR